MTRKYVIGTRGSELALWQAHFVKARLESLFPERHFQIKTIKTTGDQLLDVALSKIGDKGLFTSQIEAALINEEIDLAVHSLKDLQTAQPDGLVIAAVCEREIPNDVFVSKTVRSIDELPLGAQVATGSLRRKSQLLNYRPDLKIVEIRGNVPTRLKKFHESDLDGLILAYAGIFRLGLENSVCQLIPFSVMLPAVGQGAVAVEARSVDANVLQLAAELDAGPTRICIAAERSFLRRLEGGCQVPIGAYAAIENGALRLEGMVGSLDGSVIFRDNIQGGSNEAEDLGVRLAEGLIEKGAGELLAETRTKIEGSWEATM